MSDKERDEARALAEASFARWIRELCGEYIEAWCADCVAEAAYSRIRGAEAERDEALARAEKAERERNEARYTAQLYRERCQMLDAYDGLPPLPWEASDE
jgi:uncharacterized phage-associated protein